MTKEEIQKNSEHWYNKYKDAEKRIADLERENRTLKSILYCTKRSCNNCGKVNCENFQRQRIDCCGLWVSYKDYITELENKIADIKANCDLAIEGRDVKIKELEKENARLTTNEKSLLAERKIIVKENAELKADNDARKFAMAMSEKVEKQLREENARLKKKLEYWKLEYEKLFNEE